MAGGGYIVILLPRPGPSHSLPAHNVVFPAAAETSDLSDLTRPGHLQATTDYSAVDQLYNIIIYTTTVTLRQRESIIPSTQAKYIVFYLCVYGYVDS